jgi:hypothetical protein
MAMADMAAMAPADTVAMDPAAMVATVTAAMVVITGHTMVDILMPGPVRVGAIGGAGGDGVGRALSCLIASGIAERGTSGVEGGSISAADIRAGALLAQRLSFHLQTWWCALRVAHWHERRDGGECTRRHFTITPIHAGM